MRLNAWSLGMLCLFFAGVASAAPEIDAHRFKNHQFKLSGYVDTSYNYLSRSNRFISGRHDRVFDLETNGFTLQQASLTLSKKPLQGFGGLLNILVGRDAIALAPNGMNPNVFGLQNFGLAIPQAYLQYNYSTVTVKAGEMLTLAGIELYDYTQDKNFSRSILDGYAEPGVHVGLRGIEKVNEQFSLIAGINNGWNAVSQPGRQNTIELGLSYVAPHRFSLVVAEYNGLQPLTDKMEGGPKGRRNLLDIFGTLVVTDKLSFSANYDYGIQTKAAVPAGNVTRASWQGIAGYIHYIWTDKWLTTLRGETFNDAKGYRTGVRQNWRELTLTLGYRPLKKVELRAETRHDFSNVKAYLLKSDNRANSNQQSFSLEALYQF